MNKWCFPIFALACVFLSFRGVPPVGATAHVEQPHVEQLVELNNEFALDLYLEIARNTGGNIFFSPYSVSSALAMTYGGARGETEEQMRDVLRFEWGQEKTPVAFSEFDALLEKTRKENEVELAVANSIWPQAGYRFREEYTGLLEKFYDAGVTPVNYMADPESARKKINSWVEEKTKERIKNLIGDGVLTPLTRLVLVNAIYFKGDWLHPFKEEATCEAPFHPDPEKEVKAAMMHQESRFSYGKAEGMQLLELPYGKGGLSMLVVLPERGTDLEKVEGSLRSSSLGDLASGMENKLVRVFLPRFTMTWGAHSLKNELQDLGMVVPFESGAADFSGMAGDPGDLSVSDVLHKAFVEVNEKGTEAAAATGVIVVTRAAAPEEPVVFRADRPFLFFIRENRTGAILFMGRCTNPSEKDGWI